MSPARIAATGTTRCATPATSGSPASPARAALVLFGVTGDLARKKLMPAIYDLANRGLLPPGFSLIGFARRDWADQDFGKIVYDSVKRARPHAVPRGGLAHAGRGHPVRARAPSTTTHAFDLLAETVATSTSSAAPAATTRSTCRSRRRSSPRSASSSSAPGLSTPPEGVVAPGRHREAVRPRPESRRASSTTIVEDVFPPDSVFRIDHYLGKETVQNLLALRFANQMFEPVWNANYVDHVQITMAEDIGIGGRAGYYDGIGAARDVIQNHLLQLLALTAMEEPVSFDAQSTCAREKEKVLSAVRLPADLGQAHRPRPVRRRLAGRRGGRRLPRRGRRRRRARRTETYAAVKLEIDTRRWAGVPFYLRTGKRLGKRVTEIAVVFKKAPHLPFNDTATEELGQNALVIRVQPDEGVTHAVRRQGARRPDGGARRDDGLRLRPRVHRELAGGLRAAHPRRAARRAAALPAARGGRAVLADPRPDRAVLGQDQGPHPTSTPRAPGGPTVPTR